MVHQSRSRRAGTSVPDMPTLVHIAVCILDMYRTLRFSAVLDWGAVAYSSFLPFCPWPSVFLPLPWITPVYEGEHPRSLGKHTKSRYSPAKWALSYVSQIEKAAGEFTHQRLMCLPYGFGVNNWRSSSSSVGALTMPMIFFRTIPSASIK